MTHTARRGETHEFAERQRPAINRAIDIAIDATSTARWREAIQAASDVAEDARQLRLLVITDALRAGSDWWELGQMLGIHPQAAFDEYANLIEDTRPPAQQRSDLAVVLTAGLAAEHDMASEYGIDLEDLGADHSLNLDPQVQRIRAASTALGDNVWIAVTLPGDFEGAEGDPEPGEDAITQWTSVALDAGELVWLREVLALNAAGDDDTGEDDDLDPLD